MSPWLTFAAKPLLGCPRESVLAYAVKVKQKRTKVKFPSRE